jgi:GxxExxY protein
VEELRLRNIPFERQKIVDVFYRGKKVGYYKLDLIVDNTVVVELKTLNHLENFYLSQLISYLRATRLKVGLVLNFATPTLEIKRVINSELL